MKRLVIFVTASFMPFSVMASDIFKCTVDGSVVLSDVPCLTKPGSLPSPKPGKKTASSNSDLQAKQEIEAEFKKLGGAQTSCDEWLRTEPTVSNSEYDGSVRQITEYLAKSLKDPDSMKNQTWGAVQRICSGYSVVVSYRAKNSFGAYVPNTQSFKFDRAGAITAIDTIK